MSKRDLFMLLLAAGTEDQVQGILDAEGLTTDPTKWTPYGDNEPFYGVVENQQAHPVSIPMRTMVVISFSSRLTSRQHSVVKSVPIGGSSTPTHAVNLSHRASIPIGTGIPRRLALTVRAACAMRVRSPPASC